MCAFVIARALSCFVRSALCAPLCDKYNSAQFRIIIIDTNKNIIYELDLHLLSPCNSPAASQFFYATVTAQKDIICRSFPSAYHAYVFIFFHRMRRTHTVVRSFGRRANTRIKQSRQIQFMYHYMHKCFAIFAKYHVWIFAKEIFGWRRRRRRQSHATFCRRQTLWRYSARRTRMICMCFYLLLYA